MDQGHESQGVLPRGDPPLGHGGLEDVEEDMLDDARVVAQMRCVLHGDL